MTILIGLRTPSSAVLGADSQLNWGDTKILGSKKLFEIGRFILGISGPARLGTLLVEAKQKLNRVTTPGGVAKTLKDLISADDWKVDETASGPRCSDVSILLCNTRTGGLYWLDGSFSVEEVSIGHFICLGAGDDIATGAMAALDTLEPKDRVRRALGIACQFNAACGGELVVREVEA